MYEIRRVISAVTFIGVVFHEFGHKFFCDITGVKVRKVCYFRIGNPAGYVIHDRPRSFIQSFLIAVGPLVTGAAFALFFFYISEIEATGFWHKLVFIWLGGSVAVNSFPSNADAKSLWKATNRHVSANIIAIVGYPFSLIIWLANSLSFLFFDVFYAIFLYHLVAPILII